MLPQIYHTILYVCIYVNVVLVKLKPALKTLWQLNYIIYDYSNCISTVITTLNENWDFSGINNYNYTCYKNRFKDVQQQ